MWPLWLSDGDAAHVCSGPHPSRHAQTAAIQHSVSRCVVMCGHSGALLNISQSGVHVVTDLTSRTF